METLCFYGVFFFCGCVWQIFVFIVEESEKMNSKHRKRVPTSVFCPSCPAAASAKLLVGKCPKPSEWKGAKTWTVEKERCKSSSE